MTMTSCGEAPLPLAPALDVDAALPRGRLRLES